MIQICARPTDAPVTNGEGLYSMEFKLGPLGYRPVMKVRARTCALAEEKLMICFVHELTGKVLDFDAKKFKEKDEERAEEAVASPGAEGSRSEGSGEGDEGQ